MAGPPGARFEGRASRVDAWYDDHPVVVASELEAIRALDPGGRGLEVGVGTAVFADALDVDVGLDPSPDMLARARGRGVEAVRGVGEALPFPDASFGRVLLLATLCFLDDPPAALAEARRVLDPDGSLLVADIPRDSRWGRRYARRAREGDPLYEGVRLRTVGEVEALLEEAGFRVREAVGTLQAGPGEGGEEGEPPTRDVGGCGYVCWRAPIA